MNKSELVERMAFDTGISKEKARTALESAIAAISNTLSDGVDVAIAGLGTFTGQTRKARTGRNPRTGEALQIAASTSVKFKAGKALRDALN